MDKPVSYERLRSLCNTWKAIGADNAQEYARAVNCDSPLAWRYYYGPAPLSLECGRMTYMVDHVTPGFHKRSAAGEVVMTPMRKHVVEINPGYGQDGGSWKNNSAACSGAQLYNPRYHMWLDGNLTYGRKLSGYTFQQVDPLGYPIPPVMGFTSSDLLSTREEASTECLAARGNASEANLWEDLAEFEQTMKLTGDLFKNLRKILVSTRDKYVVNGICSVWLMYRYGINPLIGDIEVVAAALQKVGGKRRITSRGTASRQLNTVQKRSGRVYNTYDWSGLNQVVETYSVRAMSLDEVMVTFANDCGLALKGLLSLPWELTTLSYVVDWVLNIGSLISSVVPAANATQLGSCQVATYTRRDYFTVQEYHPRDVVVLYMEKKPSDCGCERYEQYTVRTVGLENPALVLRGTSPFSNWRRCLDMIALVSQQLIKMR